MIPESFHRSLYLPASCEASGADLLELGETGIAYVEVAETWQSYLHTASATALSTYTYGYMYLLSHHLSVQRQAR